MKLNKKATAVCASVLSLSLVLTACGSSDSGSSSSSDKSTETKALTSDSPDSDYITGNSNEPEHPLIPTNTNEVGGGNILKLIMSKLVYYAADGSTHNELAESITSEDNKTWTVKLKSGLKFSDGTAIKASNFVDAWNSGYKNDDISISFFEPIVGYEVDEEGNRTTDSMSGLKVVDDTTFTIELKQPESDFPARLGYDAFAPLADSTLADREKGGELPVASGPYKFADDNAWKHNESVSLVPNPEYKGDRKAKNNGVRLKFYTSLESAYADLQANNLDVLDTVPASALGNFKSDLPGRTFQQPSAVFQSFTIQESLEHFSGEEGKLRREAFSMAINREEITNVIFSGTRIPAKDFTSPVVDGYKDSIAGNEVLSYNPDKAKELWAQADAINPWSGTFTLAYNSDGGHEAWVTAVTNSIRNTLGIEAVGAPYPDFKSLRKDVNARTITSGFRTGWQADYPSMFNFLQPLYATNASSNDGDYSNPEFDAALNKAAAATSQDEAFNSLYDAQTILFKDLPAIPLWYATAAGGWSENVDGVVVGWDSVPLYYQMTKK